MARENFFHYSAGSAKTKESVSTQHLFRTEIRPKAADVDFIADFYSEEFARYEADAIVCKMTLEHIHDTYGFVLAVR